MFAHQAQKLFLGKMGDQSLADGRAMQVQALADPGRYPMHSWRGIHFFDDHGLVMLEDRHVHGHAAPLHQPLEEGRGLVAQLDSTQSHVGQRKQFKS